MITTYQDIDNPYGRSVLPADLQRDLQRLSADIHRNKINDERVSSLLRDLSCLPLAAVAQADREIRHRASLWIGIPYNAPAVTLKVMADELLGRREFRRLTDHPGLACILTCHSDGHVREAALNHIAGPAAGPFLLVLIAYRLNDWVPQVRAAAVQCVRRVFGNSNADTVAEAIMYMLEARRDWQRGLDESHVLDELLLRDDLRQAVLHRLLTRWIGRPHRSLAALLHTDLLDRDLPRLMREGAHPAVRALAGKTLITGQARWAIGRTMQWTDRSFGLGHLTTDYDRRSLALIEPADSLLASLANDRAAVVRKIAMQAVIDAPGLWTARQGLIDRLAGDPSSAVRAGMAYVLRQQAKEKR